jgi:tRNA (guanine-N7-)-methyltransferase
MPRVRIHQHVNPLAPYYVFDPEPVELEKIFARPEQALHLDLGCGRGRFLLKMAALEKNWNFLGVEIREPLVEEANRIAREKALDNLHYEFCNAMLALDRLLERLPEDILQMVSIQFPDPWFKKKHAKRRMVNRKMVETLERHLAGSGKIFVQTDIDFLAEEMFALFEEKFSRLETAESPFPVKSEREISVENRNLPVFRATFVKK